jgi:hypothetical protein
VGGRAHPAARTQRLACLSPLAGAWADLPAAEKIRKSRAKDVAREHL